MVNNGVKIAAIVAHFCGSQKEFADRLGVATAVVSNWKKRGVETVSTIYSIIEAFPTFNPSYLFDDSAPIEKPVQSTVGSINGNGSGVNAVNNDTDVINRFLSVIEEKDRQIARLIELMGK